ncbi:MAG: hypothetical protein IJN21_01915 [Clostridia bacterium]|nr:hypothetical protein [Clostridia bacterium]
MKKKILALVLILVFVFAVPGVAEACGKNNSNTKYNQALAIVETANAQIRALVFAAQLTPYDDVELLVASTNAVAAMARYKASLLGYEVGCTYTYYKVDGRTVAIDPLYVINTRPPRPNTDTGNK